MSSILEANIFKRLEGVVINPLLYFSLKPNTNLLLPPIYDTIYKYLYHVAECLIRNQSWVEVRHILNMVAFSSLLKRKNSLVYRFLDLLGFFSVSPAVSHHISRNLLTFWLIYFFSCNQTNETICLSLS